MRMNWQAVWVWFLVGIPVLGAEQKAGPDRAEREKPPASLQPVRKIGRLAGRIEECSGVVASRRQAGVLWVHSDSGNAAVLYAMNGEGKLLAQFPVGAANQDWEDIATDDAGHLYIGDLGNNGGKRKQVVVYRVDEPLVDAGVIEKGKGPVLKVTGTWRLVFPDGPFDCESLFVHQGFGYVISKSFTGMRATVYRFPLEAQARPAVLERVTTLPIRSPVTAADISADGQRLAVLTVTGLNLFAIEGEVARAGKVEPVYIRCLNAGNEACSFVPEGVLVIGEMREMLLFCESK